MSTTTERPSDSGRYVPPATAGGTPRGVSVAEVARFVRADPRLSWLTDAPEPAAARLGEIVMIASEADFDCDAPRLRQLLSAAIAAAAAEGTPPGPGALRFRELSITVPGDIAGALKTVMSRAELGPGQVAVRTGIHRSQVYHLSNPAREALPRTHEQLLACLHACRMPARQIEVVLVQWLLLRERRRRGKDLVLPELIAAEQHLDSTPSPGVPAPRQPPAPPQLHPAPEAGPAAYGFEQTGAAPEEPAPTRGASLTTMAIVLILALLALAVSVGPLVAGLAGTGGALLAREFGGDHAPAPGHTQRPSALQSDRQITVPLSALVEAVDAARAASTPPHAPIALRPVPADTDDAALTLTITPQKPTALSGQPSFTFSTALGVLGDGRCS